MTKYKIKIEFDGTDFVGWQRQKDAISVQEAIENAIFRFCAEKVEVTSSGRTDAGVHAIEQVAHFVIQKETNAKTVANALNFYLVGQKIAILDCEKADDDFHARYHATQRQYLYIINNRQAPLALNQTRAWHVKTELNVEKMQEAAEFFLGTHDFSSFRAALCQSKSPVKTIDSISVRKLDSQEIHIEIAAQSFLHHMVRNIVGTLKMVGDGSLEPAEIQKIFEAKDRNFAGPTAKAHGLYFKKVLY